MFQLRAAERLQAIFHTGIGTADKTRKQRARVRDGAKLGRTERGPETLPEFPEMAQRGIPCRGVLETGKVANSH